MLCSLFSTGCAFDMEVLVPSGGRGLFLFSNEVLQLTLFFGGIEIHSSLYNRFTCQNLTSSSILCFSSGVTCEKVILLFFVLGSDHFLYQVLIIPLPGLSVSWYLSWDNMKNGSSWSIVGGPLPHTADLPMQRHRQLDQAVVGLPLVCPSPH